MAVRGPLHSQDVAVRQTRPVLGGGSALGCGRSEMAERILYLGILSVAAVLMLVAPAALAQERLDCEDFISQADAQAELRDNLSDPNNLDDDNNGIACDTFPYDAPDRDETPVGPAGGGTPKNGEPKAGRSKNEAPKDRTPNEGKSGDGKQLLKAGGNLPLPQKLATGTGRSFPFWPVAAILLSSGILAFAVFRLVSSRRRP